LFQLINYIIWIVVEIIDVDVWQPRLLKLGLFFLDMQRQKALRLEVGGSMALVGNFMERGKGS
jgi:hypothetical protein